MSQILCVPFFFPFTFESRRGSYADTDYFSGNIFKLGGLRSEFIPSAGKFFFRRLTGDDYNNRRAQTEKANSTSSKRIDSAMAAGCSSAGPIEVQLF